MTLKYNSLSPYKESILLPLMQFSDKLLLTGSTVLYIIGVMHREPNDIDISLSAPLTIEELNHIKNFFNLKIRHEGKEYDDGSEVRKITWDASNQLNNQEIISLISDNEGVDNIKIDIFNKHYFDPKDIYRMDYNVNGEIYPIKVLHPSIAISFKSKYAFDSRISSGTSFKHMQDLKDIIINSKYYYDVTRRIFTR